MCSSVQQHHIQFLAHTAASTLTAVKILMSRQNLAMYQEQYRNRSGSITRLCAGCVWKVQLQSMGRLLAVPIKFTECADCGCHMGCWFVFVLPLQSVSTVGRRATEWTSGFCLLCFHCLWCCGSEGGGYFGACGRNRVRGFTTMPQLRMYPCRMCRLLFHGVMWQVEITIIVILRSVSCPVHTLSTLSSAHGALECFLLQFPVSSYLFYFTQ
jgi:hypothetical protein